MVRARLLWPLALAFVVACGGDSKQPLEEKPEVAGESASSVIAEGCLTAADNRFVLTELERGAGGPTAARDQGSRPAAAEEPTTESYRLVGMEDELRPLVGQRVTITGLAEPEQVVDVRESSPPVEPKEGAPAGTAGREPQVSTVQTTRLEISDLRVGSVEPTGERCETAPKR